MVAGPQKTTTRKIPQAQYGEDALARAVRLSQDYFRRSQHPEGYWCGQLESNTTMEAEYLMLSHFLGRVDPERWRKLANHILSKQRQDGSWGQYFDSPGDLSTSVESYFALKLAGYSADSEPLRRARRFILSKGGVPGVRVFTKIWLALFGQWDWQGTPNMPPELIFLPSWAPFNLYRFASWARATVAPMLIILTRHPICPVPEPAKIDELYPGGRNQADYSLPKPDGGWGWGRLLYHLDRFVGLYKRLPLHPFRRRAERKVVQWILDHQEADGCWGGIQPPWVYSLIVLHHLGGPVNNAAVEKGFAGFEGFVIEDDDTCTVQACMSPVWDTCLAQLALLDSGVAEDDPMIQQSTTWLLDQQILASGDWQVQVKDIQPGGWAFEFHNNQYPDIDDSAEVIMALAGARLQSGDEPRRQPAIDRGVAWLEALQSNNGGWGSFDKNNNAYYLTKLPFSDFGETLDPPSVDVTAHILEMYGKLGYTRDHQAVIQGLRVRPTGAGGRRLLVWTVGRQLRLRHRRSAARPGRRGRRHGTTLCSAGRRLAGVTPEPRRRLGRKLRFLRRTRTPRGWPQHRFPDRLGPAGLDGRRPGRHSGCHKGRRLFDRPPERRRRLGRAIFHRHRLSRLRHRRKAAATTQAGRKGLPGFGPARRLYDQLPPVSLLLAAHGPGKVLQPVQARSKEVLY